MKKKNIFVWVFFILISFVWSACSSSKSELKATSTQIEPPIITPTDLPESFKLSPTIEFEPDESAVPPTSTPLPTETLIPTDTPRPTPTIDYQPLFPIGSTADWTATTDAVGIEGIVEFISATQIQIRDFVFLAAEASGVDIRLGVDRNFEDDVAVSLKDITGDTYEGGSLTLTIPDEAFDGRTFNSIGVVCYDNGEVFDWATIQSPAEE